jgi:glycosyltransferase involved in cell wall biosynthesis
MNIRWAGSHGRIGQQQEQLFSGPRPGPKAPRAGEGVEDVRVKLASIGARPNKGALWIYDKTIDPSSGGTERVTHLMMKGLELAGCDIAGFLVIDQTPPREMRDEHGQLVSDLYDFLCQRRVGVVINQIGYSTWLLKEFLGRGGEQWRNEGGRIITCLHFDPQMFATSLRELARHWRQRNLLQKTRRLGRILLLPFERRRARSTLRSAYRYLIEASDKYIILSEHYRDRMLQFSGSGDPNRISVIPNPNTFPKCLPRERLKDKLEIVLVVSRLDEPQKRLSLILKAWARLMKGGAFGSWKLQIIGEGEYAEDYRNTISSKNIPRVEMLGKCNPEKYFEAASIYLHTAKREGWGLTITEAMQSGAVPVVMHSSDVFEDIVHDGIDGFLCKDGNVREFAEHISKLMGSPKLRQRMAEHAIAAAESRSTDSVVQKWRSVLYPA